MSLTFISSPSGAPKLEMFPLVMLTRGLEYSSLLILFNGLISFLFMDMCECLPRVWNYCGRQRVFDLKLQVVGIHWNCLATGNQTFPSHLLSSRAHRKEDKVEIPQRIWDLEIYSKESCEERQVYSLWHVFYTMCMPWDRAANTFNFQSIPMILIYLFTYLLSHSYGITVYSRLTWNSFVEQADLERSTNLCFSFLSAKIRVCIMMPGFYWVTL